MEWQWSLWVILELASVIGLVILTFYSRHIFPARARSLGLAFFTAGTIYMFLNAMEIGTGALATKYMYFKLQYVLLPIIAMIWLAFILKYVREDKRFAPRTIALFSILPVTVAVLGLTNELHHLFWAGTSPSNNPFLFIYGQKPLLWFSGACIWAIFLYGAFVIGRQLRLMAEPLRGDAFGILLAVVVVLIMASFESVDVERSSQIPLSSLAWGFAIAFVFITVAFRYLREAHIRPMAEQAALNSLSDAFIAVDKQNCVFFMNASAEKLTGCTIANAYQRPLKELLPSWPQQILNIVGQPSLLAKQIRIKDNGKYSWYEIGLSPIRDSVGNLMGQVLLIHDITDRVAAEEGKQEIERKAYQASRLSTVGQMAAGICHEINNPLTTVIGYSDLLTNKDLPEDVKRELGYIREGGRRVADIVKQLLVFARNVKPIRTMVDINDIVSKTLGLREYQLRIDNIKVITELARDLPYLVADPGQLQQVFINIVLNAETEMKLAHGQGTLLVKTECVDDNIRISFEDDGPGIPEDNLNSIFDPFFTTRKVGEGTGLGLSVAHGIITEHKGRIYAQSEQGKGATFIVELPIIIEPKSVEISSDTLQEIRQTCTRPGSILIIDDEPLLLKFLEQFLTAKGHDVDAVDNANDALRVFASKKHNLILMDILMPDMNGIELYKKFHRMDKSVGSRVLIMTGDVLGKPTRTFLSRTRVQYLEKPFEPDTLMTRIDEIIGQNP